MTSHIYVSKVGEARFSCPKRSSAQNRSTAHGELSHVASKVFTRLRRGELNMNLSGSSNSIHLGEKESFPWQLRVKKESCQSILVHSIDAQEPQLRQYITSLSGAHNTTRCVRVLKFLTTHSYHLLAQQLSRKARGKTSLVPEKLLELSQGLNIRPHLHLLQLPEPLKQLFAHLMTVEAILPIKTPANSHALGI